MEENKMFNKKSILIVAIAAIVLFGIVLFIIFSRNNNLGTNIGEDKMKTQLTEIATQYFEKNIKGNVIGVDRQKVTLRSLENAGYDVSHLTKDYDVLNTYAIVNIENPTEVNKEKIKYTVESFLSK